MEVKKKELQSVHISSCNLSFLSWWFLWIAITNLQKAWIGDSGTKSTIWTFAKYWRLAYALYNRTLCELWKKSSVLDTINRTTYWPIDPLNQIMYLLFNALKLHLIWVPFRWLSQNPTKIKTVKSVNLPWLIYKLISYKWGMFLFESVHALAWYKNTCNIAGPSDLSLIRVRPSPSACCRIYPLKTANPWSTAPWAVPPLLWPRPIAWRKWTASASPTWSSTSTRYSRTASAPLNFYITRT